MKQLSYFVLLSFLLHFFISTSTLYWAEKLDLFKKDITPTELEVIESLPPDFDKQIEKTRQMIKQLKSSVQKLKSNQSLARLESEETQRFEKQTRAAQFGLTQNSAMATLNQNNLNSQKSTNAEQTKSDEGELPEFARTKTQLKSNPTQVNAPSSVSIQLPSDIQLSNATNLNTDASTYYSFYTRVEELFYVRWVERNNYHWGRISFDYKKNVLAGKVWTTELEVWLTEKGEYHSSYIKKTSGYQPFDEATVYAFKNAALFPNPPRAKVEPDGFVRLRYRFNVHVTPY